MRVELSEPINWSFPCICHRIPLVPSASVLPPSAACSPPGATCSSPRDESGPPHVQLNVADVSPASPSFPRSSSYLLLTHLTASGALIAAVPMPMMGMRAPLGSRTCCGSETGSDAAFAAPAAAFEGGNGGTALRVPVCRQAVKADHTMPCLPPRTPVVPPASQSMHGPHRTVHATAWPTCAWPAPLGAGPSHVPVPA